MTKRIGRTVKWVTMAALVFALAVSTKVTGYADDVIGPGAFINSSANGIDIYVSKLGHTLTLNRNGVTIGTYEVSLGADSASGNKVEEGDMRTPSGKFYVCTRNDKSICYLALGLSYPNIEAAERGFADGLVTEAERDEIIRANKAGEQPPWNTALGGAIEIHGARKQDGSTQGCVAVDNQVMDILWECCNLGVPVVIGP